MDTRMHLMEWSYIRNRQQILPKLQPEHDQHKQSLQGLEHDFKQHPIAPHIDHPQRQYS
jgi:hypothetical protein